VILELFSNEKALVRRDGYQTASTYSLSSLSRGIGRPGFPGRPGRPDWRADDRDHGRVHGRDRDRNRPSGPSTCKLTWSDQGNWSRESQETSVLSYQNRVNDLVVEHCKMIKDGAPGRNYIDVTYSWNGTTDSAHVQCK
jgi:hypothetical protein